MGRQKNFRRQNVRTKRMNVNSKVPPGLLFIPILFVGCAVFIGYLKLVQSNGDIGRSIKTLEKQRQDLDRRVVNEEFKLANATSPESIQRLLQKHNLVMELPGEKNVARVKRPTSGTLTAQRPIGTSVANTQPPNEEILRD